MKLEFREDDLINDLLEFSKLYNSYFENDGL